MVDKTLNADLFAFITVVDTLAKLVAGPVVAALFSIRDDMGRSLGYFFLLSVVRMTPLGVLRAHADLTSFFSQSYGYPAGLSHRFQKRVCLALLAEQCECECRS